MKLELATLDDLEALWRIRNDPVTRANSHNQTGIPLDEHRRWLQQTLNNPNRRLYVLRNPHVIGTSRMDRITDTEGEISVALTPEARGNGIGTYLIQITTYTATTALHLQQVKAEILQHNQPSLRAFHKAGYTHHHTNGDTITLTWTHNPSNGTSPLRRVLLRSPFRYL